MIYLIIVVLLVILSVYFDVNNVKIKNQHLLYYFFTLVFIILAGLRYRVGGDSAFYEEYYKTVLGLFKINKDYLHYEKSQFGFGLLWNLLCSCCKVLTNSFIFFQFVHATIINVLLMRFFMKYSKHVFINILFYFFFYYLYFNMEILRESLAVVLFLTYLDLFFRKKWLPFIIVVLIASQFHISSLILLILPFFFYTNKLNFTKVLYLFGLLAILIPITIEPIINYILSFLDEGHLKWKIIIFTRMEFNIYGIIFITTTKVVFPLFLMYLDEYVAGNNSKFRPLILAYILFALISIYFTAFERFANYLLPIYYMWMIQVFANVSQHNFFRRLRQVVVIVLIFFAVLPRSYYYFEDTSDKVKGTRYFRIWHPYHTIFSKKIDPKREKLLRHFVNVREFKERNY